MDTTPPVTGPVVVGVDGSPHAEHALAWAVEQAHVRRRPLVLLHALDPIGSQRTAWAVSAGISPVSLEASMREDGQHVLDAAVEAVAWQRPELEVIPRLVDADPRTALLEAAEDAVLLVVGSRGRGPVTSLLLGSVGMAVTRLATCPVAVVRPGPERVRSGVLVGTDAGPRCAATLEMAWRQAALTGRTLTVVLCDWDAAAAHSWMWARKGDDGFAELQLRLAEATAGLAEKFPEVTVVPLFARGVVDRCLVDLSEHYEVTVVGHHGHSMLDAWGLGSVATNVVERVDGVVLVVPS